MAYKGKYKVKNTNKYDGDHTKCIFRSLWERQVFKWCDENADILKWSSEEVIVPYRCKTDNRLHRYFPDLRLTMSNGNEYLIEIKPKKETKEPKRPTRKSQKYLREVMTYIKNQSKWEAANEYCLDKGWTFQVWTEDTIKGLGIKLLT